MRKVGDGQSQHFPENVTPMLKQINIKRERERERERKERRRKEFKQQWKSSMYLEN